MSERTLLFDDLSDEGDAERVLFSVSGVDYRIDLAKENRERFHEALAPFIAAATRIPPSGTPQGRSGTHRAAGKVTGGSHRSGPPSAEVRRWGRANGFKPAPKGKIGAELVQAFLAAQETAPDRTNGTHRRQVELPESAAEALG